MINLKKTTHKTKPIRIVNKIIQKAIQPNSLWTLKFYLWILTSMKSRFLKKKWVFWYTCMLNS